MVITIIIVTHLMNIEQYPLLQYIIKNTIWIRKAKDFWHNWFTFLIDLHWNVCYNTLYEGNEGLICIKKVWDWDIWPWMVFEFLIFIRIEFHMALRPILRQLFPTVLSIICCSSIIYVYIRAVSSYSLWYLVAEVKVSIFHIWICWNIEIFIHKGCLI